MTPTPLDFLAKCEDALQPIIEFQLDATKTDAKPITYDPGPAEPEPGVGAFNGTRPVGFISYPNNVLAYDMNRRAGTAYYHKQKRLLEAQPDLRSERNYRAEPADYIQ